MLIANKIFFLLTIQFYLATILKTCGYDYD